MPSKRSRTSVIAFVGLASIGFKGTPEVLSGRPNTIYQLTRGKLAILLEAINTTLQQSGDDEIVIWQLAVMVSIEHKHEASNLPVY